MLAAFAASTDPDDPLNGLQIDERPAPEVPEGWAAVNVRAASANRHDLWSLRGVGLRADQLPMTLGCDAAGVDDDGNEVIVHAVVSSPDWRDDETLDPSRTLLSEKYQGTLAERVVVPRRNLVPKPESLTFGQAACLPTAWLTAYRMLFTQARVSPGQTVLVQGASGGVATALVTLGAAAGVRMWVTSRSPQKAERTLELGADRVFEAGERLPARVDAVMETVGEATWSHSLRSVRPGGTVVISGATSGRSADTELSRVFFLQLKIVGSTMGTRDELERLVNFCDRTGVRPVIDRTVTLSDAASGLAALERGEVFGKVVISPLS